MTEKTIKCPICGEPYVVYSHYAGDQSACAACRRRARAIDFAARWTRSTDG